MSSNIVSLAKVLFKNTSFTMTNKRSKTSNMLYLLLPLAFLPLIMSIVQLDKYIYSILEPIGQQGLIMDYGITMIMVMTFMFGVLYVLSIFYFGKDIEMLLHMPLTPSEILGGKLVTVLIYEYLAELFMFLPVAITYGIVDKAGFAYYAYLIVAFLLLPVIPIVLASIIVMVIMRITSIGKNKEAMSFVGGIAAIILVVAFNISMQKAVTQNTNPEQIIDLFSKGENSLVGLISRIMPGASFISKALVNYDSLSALMNLAFLLLTVTGFFILFFILAEKLYFKGVAGMREANARGEKIKESEWDNTTKQEGITFTLIKREIRILLRTPSYFLNNVLVSVILPLILIIYMLILPQSGENLDQLRILVTSGLSMPSMIAIFSALGLFLGGMNGISTTGISREGKSAYVMKYLPASLEKQVLPKVYVGILIGIISIIFSSIAMLYLGATITKVLVGFIFSLNAVVLINLSGIIIDLYRPKLDWDNEVQAVKQNVNVLFVVLISYALAMGLGFIAFKYKVSTVVAVGIFGLGVGMANVYLYYMFKNKALPAFKARNL